VLLIGLSILDIELAQAPLRLFSQCHEQPALAFRRPKQKKKKKIRFRLVFPNFSVPALKFANF